MKCSPFSRLFVALLPCCLGLLVFTSVVHAQAWDSTAWVADGEVRATVRVGDTLYVGGYFSGFGPASGGLALADPTTGFVQAASPALTGVVNAIEPDGANGWFVGGFFENAGGAPRHNFAHQLSNGTWDTWSPDFDGEIYTLAVRDGQLFVGGRFSHVDGQPRGGFAVFDLSTHALTSLSTCFTGSLGNVEVRAIALTDTSVYLGGMFLTCQAPYHRDLVELSRATGLPTGSPMLLQSSWTHARRVRALAIAGNRLYVGGEFGNPNADPPEPYGVNFTAFDLTTHAEVLLAHQFTNEFVMSMCLDGSALYVGTVLGVRAFDTATSAMASWWPYALSGSVNAIRTTRTTVVVGGAFNVDESDAVRNLVILDKSNAAVVRSFSNPPSQEVRAIAMGASDGQIRVGGNFTFIGGEVRRSLALIDLRTGRPRPWNRGPRAAVTSLVVEGRRLAAGTPYGLCIWDLDSGDIVYSGLGAGTPIEAMTALQDTLYFSGSSTINGNTTFSLHSVDLRTLEPTGWAPTVDNYVYAMRATGDHIYLGGNFTKVNSVLIARTARVNRQTGVLDTGWQTGINGIVTTMLSTNGRLYAGGSFSHVSGVAHPGLAVFDTVSGALVPETAALTAGQTVYALAEDAEAIHVGGTFTTLSGVARGQYGAVSRTDGSLVPSALLLGGHSYGASVRALASGAEVTVIGGLFRSVNHQPSGYLALLRKPVISAAQTMSPATLSTPRGVMTGTCTGRVTVFGVTNAMGPAPGLVAQLGYGPATDAPSSPSWTWMNGTFSTDLSGADEWAANLTPTTAGTFAYGWRFSYAGSAWVYADLDGSANGWSAATAGVLTVIAPTVDFAVMTGPASMNVGTFHESGVVSASVWMEGVTEGWGGNADLVAQLGVGPEGEDPSTSPLWAWTNANWTGKDGGNDVYGATLLPLEPGTSRYVYRFRYQNSVWKYADLDGTGNGFDPASMGTLTVFAQEPDANGQLLAPQQLVVTVGEGSRMALGHFAVMHVADPVPLMNAHFGWGPAGTRPDTSSAWTWGSVFFDPYQTGHDDWGGMVFPAPAVAGEYAYTFRFRYDGGTWAYADLDGSANGCDPAQLGRLSVSAQPTIGWSRLDTQAPVVADAGVQTPVQGLAWSWPSAGLRANATFAADVGFGPHGTLPDVSPAWQWSPASLVEDLGDGTRHWEGLLRGTQAGEYDWCFRFRRDGGPYAYADLDGGDDGYELDAAGRFTVTGTLDAAERLPDALAFGIAGANPARGGASLRLALPNAARVRVTIHDIAGRCVAQLAEGERGAGVHVFEWRPANGAGAAVWFAQASVNGRVLTRRFVTIE